MIRVAIVEDEIQHAKNLENYLARYTSEHGTEFNCVVFNNGLNFLGDYKANFNIVFLDIEMPHMNGMEVATRLRKIDPNVTLIFVTSMVQYAVKGYEVEAAGYMVKPVEYFSFSVLLDKVTAKLSHENLGEIVIRDSGEIHRISVRDLAFIEVMDHYLIYHIAGGGRSGTLREIGKMKDVEEKLGEMDFFRCSNSHLVNMRFVSAVKNNEVIVGGETVYISRRRKKEFLLAVNTYLRRTGV